MIRTDPGSRSLESDPVIRFGDPRTCLLHIQEKFSSYVANPLTLACSINSLLHPKLINPLATFVAGMEDNYTRCPLNAACESGSDL